MNDPMIRRRVLLTSGLSALGGLALTSPSARAARRLLSSPGADGKNLVLIQLSGGNDGLSTVVPYADDAYGRSRRTTAFSGKEVRKLDDYRGLHPNLENLERIYKNGRLAIVEGTGYPDAVRSHFKSFEVWHTADARGRAAGDGWVGRLADAAWSGAPEPELVVHIGRETPYSLYSSERSAVSLESPTGYKWFGESSEERAYAMAGGELEERRGEEAKTRRNSGRDAALAHLRSVLDDARDSSSRIRRAVAEYEPDAEYPRSRLAARLHDIAAMINGGLGTRVFSASIGGFDTHSAQRGPHGQLMTEVDGAVGAFLEDLSRSGSGRDTVVVLFSEFGRRVEENGSRGHDHGKAGPMFVLGHRVQGGLYGKHPSLTELDGGDLTYTTDFRSVYASVIEGWFGIEHEKVLGARYPLLDLFA